MKLRASELKKRSRVALSGNYGVMVGGTLIIAAVVAAIYLLLFLLVVFVSLIMGFSLYGRGFMGIVGFGFGMIVIASLVFILIMAFIYYLQAGLLRMLFQMSIKQPFSIRDMGFAFTHRPLRFLGIFGISLGIGLVLSIPYDVVSFASAATGYIPIMIALQVLMYILLLVGSILYQLYFSLTVILLVENPEKRVLDCFRESARIMEGNKGRLFYLWLSFIGMVLLGFGSCGIGLLWVVPYMLETFIQFYLDIKSGPEFAQRTSQNEETSYLNGVPCRNVPDY